MAEHEETCERGDGRLQAEQDAEDRRSQASEGEELEGVRQDGREHSDAQPLEEDLRVPCLRAVPRHVPQAEGEDHRRRHDHGQRQALELGEGGPRPAGEDDVRGPADARSQRQGDAGDLELRERQAQRSRDEQHSDARGGHGQQVAWATGEDGGQGERTDELDRHRDTDRQVPQGGVEGEVHQAHRQAEADDRAEVATAVAAPPGPRDEHQQDRRDAQTQDDRAGRADLWDQRRGEGAAELHGQHPTQDQ